MSEVRPFPIRGYTGMVLVAVAWPLAWGQPEVLRFAWENAFLLLWVGYCLIVDALVWKGSGTSPFSRNRKAYLGMFLISMPAWWLFEFFNIFLQNWYYIYSRPIGAVEFVIGSSIHFSIVIPAVLTTAELWSSSHILKGAARWRRVTITNRRLGTFMLIGIIMLAGVIGLPRYCYPLVWICLYLICDSLNMLMGSPSLFRYLERGNWRPPLALSLGALTCGFFWEMWNFYSLPKWVYSIPFVNVLHIFEMPLPGYLGYLPFGLEVFALYHLLLSVFGLKGTFLHGGESYVRL